MNGEWNEACPEGDPECDAPADGGRYWHVGCRSPERFYPD